MGKVKLTRLQKREARRIALKWLHQNPGGSLADARRELPGVIDREGFAPDEIATVLKFVLELIQQILALFRKA